MKKDKLFGIFAICAGIFCCALGLVTPILLFCIPVTTGLISVVCWCIIHITLSFYGGITIIKVGIWYLKGGK